MPTPNTSWSRFIPGQQRRPASATPTRRMPNIVITRRNLTRSSRPPAHPKTLRLTKSKRNLMGQQGIASLGTRKNIANKKNNKV